MDFGCWLTFPTSYIIHTVLYDYCFCCNFVLVFPLSLVIDYGVMDLINCKNNYSNRNGLVLRSILTTLWKKHLMTSHWSSFLLSCLLQEASQQQCLIFLLIFIFYSRSARNYLLYKYLLSFQNSLKNCRSAMIWKQGLYSYSNILSRCNSYLINPSYFSPASATLSRKTAGRNYSTIKQASIFIYSCHPYLYLWWPAASDGLSSSSAQ